MSASHKTKEVIVLCPNGRRVTIKTSITTSIGQIIEEACLKQKFEPYSYNIKHLQRTLDPSSTLQYSNIPNHAQLELIEASERREEGCVTVNLVTDRGQRLISDFSPSSSLWDVLIHHENQTENNFCIPTASSGLEPFIVYTMRKVIGEELKSVTLKSLGLFRGRCMMRYNVQKLLSSGSHLESNEFSPVVIVKPKTAAETSKKCPEEHKVHNVAIQIESSKELEPQQEMVPEPKDPFPIEEMECGQFLESDSISMPAGEMEILEQSEAKFESSVIEDLTNQNDFRGDSPPHDDVSERLPLKNSDSADNLASDQFEQDVTEQTLAPKIIPLSDHDSLLFSLDDAAPTLPSQESDDFFELTVAEVHSLYREQKKQLEEMDKMPFMTQQMRQLDKDSRLLSAMNRHPVTQLRICFPDRHVIQANFKPRDTIKEVMDFLRPLLVKSDLNFYLYTTFPRKVLDPELSLVEAGCIPKARLYFDANEDGLTFLSEKTLGKKSSFEGASNAVIKSSTKRMVRNQENFLSSQEAPSRSSAQISQPEPNVNRINSTQNQLKPKWFRLGK